MITTGLSFVANAVGDCMDNDEKQKELNERQRIDPNNLPPPPPNQLPPPQKSSNKVLSPPFQGYFSQSLSIDLSKDSTKILAI